MTVSVNISVCVIAVGLLTSVTAAAQKSDSAAPEASSLRSIEAMILLDYQVLRVVGDKPIDLLGFHVHHQVADWLYLGAGLYAPLLRGEYGGFTAFDIAAHARQRLTNNVFATAGLSLGGGAGGRSVEQAKTLSGSGGFFKGSIGLGYDFGEFSVGASVAKMKFRRSAINSTQANVFMEIPYTYLTGPFSSRGQRLSPADAGQASKASSEKMLTVSFDNFKQRDPEGSVKGVFNIVDLQYAQFVDRDTFWFADLGVGYRGLPLSNQVFGGLGQRVRLSPDFSVYGQLGIGSGIYAPAVINTGPGLLLYPKVSAEYALTKNLGLSLSAGYLAAPKGSSKNIGIGLALTHHIGAGAGESPALTSGPGGWPSYQGVRVSLFQQVDSSVRFRDVDRGRLQMIGIQADAIAGDYVYIPLQASVAYSTYLGYPGYGELLAGIGLQSRVDSGDHLQVFGQLMAGTNVHGLAVKASGGLRYGLSDRLALHVAAGRMQARSAAGNSFTANSLVLGLDYRFSIPAW
jgi:hypothetical protein